jgi:cytochrome d ubiquinol oxidase subunit II
MSLLGFIVVATILTMYVLTDGYDLGVASVAPLVTRSGRERAAAMESIGPFWSGNEVWLVVAGGVLFAFFPKAYACAFSGFYLPFMLVLWLLMFRGIALELRNHFTNDLWRDFWDAAFSLSSLLLIVLFGVAIGNLIRGVPLDADGYFTGTFAFLLNPYALGVALLALTTLAQHGLMFLMMRINGPPAERAHRMALRLWPALVALYLLVTIATFAVQPRIFDRGIAGIAGIVLVPTLALAALVMTRREILHGRAFRAFLGSSAFIAIQLIAAAATMYPYLLLAYPAGTGGLTIDAAKPSATALATIIPIILAGLLIVVIYTSFVVRRMEGKIVLSVEGRSP